MLQPLLLFIVTFLIGYALSLYFSKPVERNGELKPNRLPTFRIGNIELLPNLRIHIGSKTYWLHHWLYLTIFTLGLFLTVDEFAHLLPVKGAAIGGILHGLRYPDRFKFRHPRENGKFSS